jgi:hypothetical protein
MQDSWVFEAGGKRFAARVERDERADPPWDYEDGHGPVSDWTTRDKRAGELVLCEDRGSRRFYDFAAACRIARRDGWGFLPWKLEIRRDAPSQGDGAACGGWAIAGPFKAHDPENFNRAIAEVCRRHRETMTPREYAARAAMRDFKRLRDWCDDTWCYVGVIVAPVCECCGEPDENRAQSVWGIESDCEEYIRDTAEELALWACEDAACAA